MSTCYSIYHIANQGKSSGESTVQLGVYVHRLTCPLCQYENADLVDASRKTCAAARFRHRLVGESSTANASVGHARRTVLHSRHARAHGKCHGAVTPDRAPHPFIQATRFMHRCDIERVALSYCRITRLFRCTSGKSLCCINTSRRHQTKLV